MKKWALGIVLLFSCLSLITGQPLENRQKYDVTKDKVLYTVGYAHLDTQWLWDYPTTINEFIKYTMENNFRLFEKYPDYVFNFTGSRRYEMMKEYYPELYKKVIDYIRQGRWYVSGSSVDEGEVNISGSESIIRQVLYGNSFFKKEFGKESVDYMLPDCFGFLANLPSLLNHCGLKGFSTQKLTWRSAVGIPFNVGVWNGPDGKGVIAALNATDYTGHVEPRLDTDSTWIARLNDDYRKYGMSFDYRYYGVGDQGGAPRDRDVYNAVNSLRNTSGGIKVILTSSDQMYRDITPEIRAKLPVYSGDLLLIEHSAGSLTSQAYMKRMNRKNELLAMSAEELASTADWLGTASYPSNKLNHAWDLVLGSQFHDILPGTSIPKAYEYAWNDEFIAANGFSEVLKNSVSAITENMDTRVNGRAITVFNPVECNREDIVTAELEYTKLPENITVTGKNGKVVPSQIIERKANSVKFIFIANVPSLGMEVYSVNESSAKPAANGKLKVTDRTLENENYVVKFDEKGNIISMFDKKLSRELISKPADLEFQKETPSIYPSWNMDWKDRKNPPCDYLDKEATFRVVENGPVRVAVEITRKGLNSVITQKFSLASGDAGKRLEVTNKIDWQSKGVSLKAAFPFTANNEKATYNLGVGTIERTNNNETKFEVPSKEWFDLTDVSGKYGITVLEDCKYGSDKPDNNTLRLTLLYTPTALSNVHEGTQDWGLNDVRYGLYAHAGDWAKAGSQWQGKFFNQPLLAFEAPKHDGKLGKNYSVVKINNPGVGLMAFKKAEEGNVYIVRVNELTGKDLKNVTLTFAGKIADAYEVNGQEQKTGISDFSNGTLHFDISHYAIRSFAIRFVQVTKPAAVSQQSVSLPYNSDVMSYDTNKGDGDMRDGSSMPAEMINDTIVSEDVHFRMGSRNDMEMNAVTCNGQTISLPAGNFNRIYILAAATDDTEGIFSVDGNPYPLKIQKWTGYIGQFYLRHLTLDNLNVTSMDEPFSKQSDIAWFASHKHNSYPLVNDAYHYSYMFKYEISLPENSKTLVLPQNKKIKILSITAVRKENNDVRPLQPLYDNFSDNPSFRLREQK